MWPDRPKRAGCLYNVTGEKLRDMDYRKSRLKMEGKRSVVVFNIAFLRKRSIYKSVLLKNA